jgi:predicted ferric reductase
LKQSPTKLADNISLRGRAETARYIVWVVFWVAVAVIAYFWWLSNGPHLFRTPASLITGLGRLSGLLGAFFIVLEFVSMSRMPLLEWSFGRVRQAVLHKWSGYLGYCLVVLHFFAMVTGYALSDHLGLVAEYFHLLSTFEDVLQASLALVLLTSIVGLSIWFVRRHVSYEAWYWVHLSSYLAIVLGFGHQLKVGADFIGQPVFVAFWYGLYIATLVLIVFYRFTRPLWLSLAHSLSVEEVVQETSDVFSIVISGKQLQKLCYQGGQFATWWFLDGSLAWQGHPFSFSSTPGDKHIRITFKVLGDYTRKLPLVKPGTRVIMDGPHGIFTASLVTKPSVLLIGGGIGITPIRSMLGEVAAVSDDIAVVYAVRGEQDQALGAELESKAMSAGTSGVGIQLSYIASEQSDYPGARGYLDYDALLALVPDVASRQVFLCGPPAMMRAVTATLLSLGVASEDIHTEAFSF